MIVQFRHVNYSRLSGFFNWTMTYRRDSDVFAPYGSFNQSSQPTSALWVKSGNRGNLKYLKVNDNFASIFHRQIVISFLIEAELT